METGMCMCEEERKIQVKGCEEERTSVEALLSV
jgi:hypothetical protein